MRRHIACFAALLCAPMAYGSQITKDMYSERPQIMHGPILAFHYGRGPEAELEGALEAPQGYPISPILKQPDLVPKQSTELEGRGLLEVVSPYLAPKAGLVDPTRTETRPQVLLASFYFNGETPQSNGIQKVPVPAAGLLLFSGFGLLGLLSIARQTVRNAARRYSRFGFGRAQSPKANAVTSRFTRK